MRSTIGLTWVALAGLLVAPVSANALAESHYVKRRQIEMPIEMTASETSKLREFRLYVSNNRGRSWQSVQTLAPTAERVSYVVPSDGEYWLTLATVDRSGTQKPANLETEEPDLKIVVDSKAPQIEMSRVPRSMGEASVEWAIIDDNLDINSFVLELQEQGGPWKEIRCQKTPTGIRAWPSDPTKNYQVRLTVRDLAGAEQTSLLAIPAEQKGSSDLPAEKIAGRSDRGERSSRDLAGMNSGRAPSPAPSAGDDDEVTPAPPPVMASKPKLPVSPETDRMANRTEREQDDVPPPPRSNSSLASSRPAMSSGEPVASPTPRRSDRMREDMPREPSTSDVPSRDVIAAKPTANEDSAVFDRSKPDYPANAIPIAQQKSTLERSTPPGESVLVSKPLNYDPRVSKVANTVDRNQLLEVQTRRTPVAHSPGGASGTPIVPEAPPTATGPTTVVAEKPVTKPPYISSTNRIQVNYSVTKVGPSGVGKVELYTTTDNGQSWKLSGEDADRMPPFDVELPGEGRYGLKVVVTNPAGFGMKPPVRGDKPDMFVEVDMTTPGVTLFEPIPDPSGEANVLVLQWESQDKNLAPTPVSLLFMETPNGPGYRIKSDLPASGQYRWKLPQGIPGQVYIKVISRDWADNVNSAQTKDAVIVDFSKPEVEVLDISANQYRPAAGKQ